MKLAINVLLQILGIVFNFAILLIAIYLVYTTTNRAFAYGKGMLSDSNSDRPYKDITIEIKEDATPADIANLLHENELISNAYVFRFQTKMNGVDDLFLPGEYALNTQMETSEIIEILQDPSATTSSLAKDEVRITIREGFTIRQMAEYLESIDVVTADEFLEACEKDIYRYSFLSNIPERENRLEGYLFPDTYFITENYTAEQIVHRLLSQFEKVYSYEYMNRTAELGLTMDEVITMASIVEKEIQIDSERAKAASVIYNRLEKGMNLQMCSTIMYALGKRKDRLLDEDLKVESPYNTYLYPGLPVGPIGSPGEACIRAVLFPDETDYLYFVLKGDGATEHVFTHDYSEFLNAKEIYQQRF